MNAADAAPAESSAPDKTPSAPEGDILADGSPEPIRTELAPAEGDARSDDTLLYPKNSPERPAAGAARDDRGDSWPALLALALAAAGAWLLLRRRGLPLSRLTRSERKIVIEETRSLGGRQHLVLVGCESRRLLLGVSTGQIQLLADLGPSDASPRSDPDPADEPPSSPIKPGTVFSMRASSPAEDPPRFPPLAPPAASR